MAIDQRFENIAYTLMLVLFLVGFYVIQHECVSFLYNGVMSLADMAAGWIASIKAKI